MAKENVELLRVFNTYLNKQEKKAVAPENAEKAVSHEQDYRLKMDGVQQQDNEKHLDFQLPKQDENEGGLEWQDLPKKLQNIRPESLTDEERYKKMKSVIKAVKAESIEHGMLSVDDMMEWAMSTAVVDGTSIDFMSIINAMKGINEIFSKRETAWNKYDKILEKQKSGQATENEVQEAEAANKTATKSCYKKYYALAQSAHKYIDSHDGAKWSSKGKNRLAFANYILSSDFVKKYVVKFRKSQYKEDGLVYSDNLDGYSFILAYGLQQDTLKMQAAVSDDLFDENKRVKAKYDGFPMGDVKRTPSRVLYDPATMLSSPEGMEAERRKVTTAMEAYAGIKVKEIDKDGNEVEKKVVNKEPMYTILDGIVEEVCKYEITKEMFQKDYFIKRPYEMLKLRQLSTSLGDCLDENGNTALGGDCGKEYLDLLKHNSSYTKFYAKLTFLFHLWDTVLDYNVAIGCFRTEDIVVKAALYPDSIIDHTQFLGVPDEEADAKDYQNLDNTPADWLNSAVEQAKNDYHITEEMKKYMNSSIFSSIRVPKRANKSGKK